MKVPQPTQGPSLGVKTPDLLLTFSKCWIVWRLIFSDWRVFGMLPLLSYRSPAVGFCSQEGGLGMVRDCIAVAEEEVVVVGAPAWRLPLGHMWHTRV